MSKHVVMAWCVLCQHEHEVTILCSWWRRGFTVTGKHLADQLLELRIELFTVDGGHAKAEYYSRDSDGQVRRRPVTHV